jgi:signal transduction histidine kinase
MTAAAEARRPRRGARWLPWLLGASGLAASVLGATHLRSLELRNQRLLAEDDVSARMAAFEGDVREAISLTAAAKAIFDASDDVTRQEFATLARLLMPRMPAPAALLWLPRVPRGDREAFEEAVRRSGVTGFTIYDSWDSVTGTTRAAGDREEHYPLIFFEPPSPIPLGFDPAGTPRRVDAMRRAVDHAAPAADRLMDPTLPHGMALDIVVPVYRQPEAPQGVVARRAALRGFLGTHMDLVSFVDASLTRVPRGGVADTWLFDELGERIYERLESGAGSRAGVRAADLRAELYYERVVQVADRHWTLLFRPQIHQARAFPVNTSLLVLLLGMMLTALTVLYTVRLQTSGASLERQVEERTRDLRETMEQLQQAQKMEAVGRLTGGIAHDFNNLLTIVIGNVSLARDAVADESVRSTLLDPALNAAQRGADLTQRLLAFSRRQALRPGVVAVPQLLDGMRDLLRRTLGGAIELEIAPAPDAWPILVDPSQLEASLLNLCINARDAMPRGGRIVVWIENARLSADASRVPEEVVPGDYVLVSVADNGQGMSDEVKARAFEPFFTTKAVGKGSGLGLSMVFGFVKQSHGHITLDSQPGHGTAVRMYFPRAKE